MHLVVRADGTPEIGVGHLMRTFALAEAGLARGWRVTLAGAAPASVLARFTDAGAGHLPLPFAAVPDPGDVLHAVTPSSGDWCVVDGYRFSAAYTGALRRAGWQVAVVDDLADATTYDADLVINQNLGAERLPYAINEDASRVLGARYAMVRREFTGRAWDTRRHPHVADRLLVTMGGGDPDQVAARVVTALADPRFARLETRVVVGPANPDGLAAIGAAAAGASGRVEIVTAADMPALMAWASMMVTAAGSTVWEGAFAGVPMLLVVTADNQAGVAAEAHAAGAARSLGRAAALTPASIADAIDMLSRDQARRVALSECASRLVDGGGADRVADALAARRLQASGLTLSAVTADDAEPLWQLANDPAVRDAAFDPAPIPFASHVAWLERRLSADGRRRCRIVVARPRGATSGPLAAQIRYDVVVAEGGERVAEIDFAVAPTQRGQGLGTALLAATVDEACNALGVRVAHGLVLSGNAGSATAFRRAGFLHAGNGTREGRAFEVFERRVSGRKHV